MPQSPARADGSTAARLALSVRLRNPGRAPLDRALVARLCRTIARNEGLTGKLVLSVHLLDDAGLREVNREQRGIDAATDVLSFPLLPELQTSSSEFTLPPGEPRHLGDVLISVERAQAQAREYRHSLERELCYLLVHGVLHLLGYDHVDESDRRDMRRREELALAPFGLTR